jgi:CheY-like chemotaxis protein
MARFLIADDSATVRQLVRSWLESAGHEVTEAADGTQALERLRADAGPLIVLLDYEMPGLTGDEVLERALADGRTPPRCAYAVISGLQSRFPPAFSDLLRRLAVQILPKPFERDTLLMLARYLAARQQAALAGQGSS